MVSVYFDLNDIRQGVITLLIAAMICIAAVAAVRMLFKVSSELSRKLVHLGVVAIACVWIYAFEYWTDAVICMAAFVILVYPILILLEKTGLIKILNNIVHERGAGELRMSLVAVGCMVMIVATVCCGIFNDRILAISSILSWGPGDALAALVGKKYGVHKIGKEKKKSLEGTFTMGITSAVCVFGVLFFGTELPLILTVPASVIVGIISAFTELHVLNGLDTIICPVVSMVVLIAVRMLL